MFYKIICIWQFIVIKGSRMFTAHSFYHTYCMLSHSGSNHAIIISTISQLASPPKASGKLAFGLQHLIIYSSLSIEVAIFN